MQNKGKLFRIHYNRNKNRMAKEAYYFPHEYDTRSDDKMAPFVMEHGAIGYGIYWIIVELLHKSEDSRIEHKANTIKRIAATSKVGLSEFEAILKSCLDYELLREEEGFIYNDRVLRNKNKRQDIREKRKQAGSSGGINRVLNQAIASESQAIASSSQAIASNLQAKVKQNQANPSKGKERKGNKEEYIGANAPSKEEILERNKSEVAKRQKLFYESLVPFVTLYSKEMIRAFFNHWSEPNRSYTKIKMDYEKTWDLTKRLEKWHENSINFSRGKTQVVPLPTKNKTAEELLKERGL